MFKVLNLLLLCAVIRAQVTEPTAEPTTPDKCDQFCIEVYQPLCGSDGKTYSNECKMEMAKCKMGDAGQTLTVAHQGECKMSSTMKPCNNICPFIYMPVCGSDGKTYGNKCQLEVARCMMGMNGGKIGDARQTLTVAHQGDCKMSSTMKPCNKACTFIHMPVCGSDGKTYANKCQLEVARCMMGMSGRKLMIDYEGMCRPQSTRNPVTKDPCFKICNKMLDRVCGSDNKTYGNPCILGQSQCRMALYGKKLSLSYKGPCKKNATCDYKCQVPTTSPPICGNDGKQYASKCYFYQGMCKYKQLYGRVLKRYFGACNGTGRTTRLPPIVTTTSPRCSYNCSPRKYVCLTNGRTTTNCLVNYMRCRYVNTIHVHQYVMKSYGRCPTKATTSPCNQICLAVYDPVCGSNMVTYSSRCQLNAAACHMKLAGRYLYMKYKGRCQQRVTTPNPVGCEVQCPNYRSQICGSNAKTYDNSCYFSIDQCKARDLNYKLVISHTGACKSIG